MEFLSDALASLIFETPVDPMTPEWISVQSRGIKQWLTNQIAGKLGICANINFVFPKNIVDLLLSGVEHINDPGSTLDQDSLFWLIMDQLYAQKNFKNLKSVQKFIQDDHSGQKKFGLCQKISKIFDDYQVYRPEMLLQWENKQFNKTDVQIQWQAELWNRIVTSKNFQNHIAHKMDWFLKQPDLNNSLFEKFPGRISFFGIFSLPPIFLQMLEKISHYIDVHLFLLAPTNQFFFDIKSKKQIEKIALKESSNTDDTLYFETANPLLSSLGSAGKNFFSFIEEFNYHEPKGDFFADPLEDSQTMLAYLQSDILNLINRKKGQGDAPVQIKQEDESISIHSCHSPMREAQVLKDLLLDNLEKDKNLFLHDIIVMMPDIEAYAPFIESVFSLEHKLVFAISDRKKRSESQTLKAFFQILSLKNERLEKTQILDLLLSEPIARKFEITTQDVSVIQKIINDAHILWGKNSEHRKSLGLPPIFENSWEFGLQRLFMGMAMPQAHENLIEGILPCPSLEGLELSILGKFSRFCNKLFDSLDMFRGEKTIEKWCIILRHIMVSLLDPDIEGAQDISFLSQNIESLNLEASKTGFKHKVSFEVVHSYIEHKLDLNISQGNFLSGKITFCNLMPMRSIPYKVVVLMGMDEKSFPRKVSGPGLDLMKNYPLPGDKNQRHEDCYMFLETLLSARSKFIITYTGRSLYDNSTLPCSSVVSELCDAMKQSFDFKENYNFHLFHPLHPFDESYFSLNPFSYSSDNCKIATALRAKTDKKQLFIPSDFSCSNSFLEEISLEELIRFFKNPMQFFLKEGLGITLPVVDELSLERESFTITGLEQYFLGTCMVEKNGALQQNEADLYPLLKGQGILPFGEKGHLEYQRIKSIADSIIEAGKYYFSKPLLPPLTEKIEVSGLNISGTLSSIYSDGMCFVDFGKLNGARLYSAWVKHLFLNACLQNTANSKYSGQTVLIGQAPEGRKPAALFTFSPNKEEAFEYLKDLTQTFIQGMEKPFVFFCETSWKFASVLEKSDYDTSFKSLTDARYKCMDNWYGSHFKKGEIQNRYTGYCVEHDDPFQSVETMMESGFVKNSLDIFKPVIKHLRRVL